MAEYSALQLVTAAQLNRHGILKYGRRDSTSSNATSSTDVGVLRVDSISVVSGRIYVINYSCHPNSSVASDVARVRVRGSTSGNATTSSTALTSSTTYAAIAGPREWRFVYIAAATATLSILLCVARDTGSGNVNLFADGGDRNTELWIEDMGIASDTGTDV